MGISLDIFDKAEISHLISKGTSQTNEMFTSQLSDEDKIKQIVEKRLVRVPTAMRKFLPPILSDPKFSLATVREKAYLLVAFLSEKDRKRIQDLTAQGYPPFPGLIAPSSNVKANWRLENSKKILIKDCSLKNIYAVSLGKDVMVIFVNHTQSIKTEQLSEYKYKIPLAYLVSYGDEINKATWDDYLENFIVSSMRVWRSNNAG